MDKIKEKMDMTVVEDEIPLNQIQNLVYVIRGQQVMLDSDLAMLYQVETKQLNRAVKRNQQRFPMDFCFQLTEDEFLRCQIGTSKINDGNGSESRGGRRYLPYVFNEQGIAMLSAVLRSETAIRVSIQIMNAFVEMRKFISSNALLFERISEVELIEYIGNFHDRFLILDNDRTYHIGASLKDAGKKCFALSLLKDKNVAKDIIGHIKSKRLSSCGNK